MPSIPTIVRSWIGTRDRFAASHSLRQGGLMLPGGVPRTSLNDLTKDMDAKTALLMREIEKDSPLSDDEWDAFLELIPNVRKLRKMKGTGGV